MPVDVRIQRFQSIEDATIQVEGFTAITGPNNSGKTAAVRAVTGVFVNAPADGLVRYGADDLNVRLSFSDGHSVQWVKGPKTKPTYIIDGKKPIHPGRQVPDELTEIGVTSIQAGTQTVWPQIAQQFTGQVFLLDLSGASLAEALSDVERVGRLNDALRMADSDRRSAASTLKVRQDDVVSYKAEVNTYKGLASVETLVLAVEQHQQKVTSVGSEYADCASLRTRWGSVSGEVVSLEGIEQVSVPSAETVDKIRRLGTVHQEASRLNSRREEASQTVESLQGISLVHVPEVPDVSVRTRLAEALDLQGRRTAAFQKKESLQGIEAVVLPTVSPDVRTVKERLMETRVLQKRHVTASSAVSSAENVAAVISGLDFPSLEQQIKKAMVLRTGLNFALDRKNVIKGQQKAIAGLLEEIRVATLDFEAASEDVRAVLREIKVCPVCGGDTSSC